MFDYNQFNQWVNDETFDFLFISTCKFFIMNEIYFVKNSEFYKLLLFIP